MAEINFKTNPIENPLGFCESCKDKFENNAVFFFIKMRVCKRCFMRLTILAIAGIVFIGFVGTALFLVK